MYVDKTYQGSLFDDCSKSCVAFGVCGGHRNTAPCGCAWPAGHAWRHQCHQCYLLCRERGKYGAHKNLQVQDFAAEIAKGYSFDQVELVQPVYKFPECVPSFTETYREGKISLQWVAVDVKSLFNCRMETGAVLKPVFSDEKSVRKYLNVTENCRLIAVLNGKDKYLESIWATKNRSKIFKKLKEIGFEICTGPTFSISQFTAADTPTPFSHHVAMYMRHHRVLSEIQDAGLCAVPNLYWIDRDKRQLADWRDWLINNKAISMISMDFTSIKKWPQINPKLLELLQMLKVTGRTFHILFIGSGQANASKIMTALKGTGHTVSVITSAPIIKALCGYKYVVNIDGKLSNSSVPKSEATMSSLMISNLKTFENSLRI